MHENEVNIIEKLILGTAQIGLNYGINNSKFMSTEDANQILNIAHSSGINFLDTAETYGVSHKRIGDFHRNTRKRFDVITKIKSFGRIEDFKAKIEGFLKELNVDKLYCLEVHSTQLGEINVDEYFNQVKDLVKNFGISIYTEEDYYSLKTKLEPNIVQLPFNILDNLTHRGSLFTELKDNGVKIHARSIFLQGILTSNFNQLLLNDPELTRTMNFLKSLINKNQSIEGLAMSYALLNKDVDGVIFGVDSIVQLEENIRLLESIEEYRGYTKEINNIDFKNQSILDPRKWKIKQP